jgi:hypothetical protein
MGRKVDMGAGLAITKKAGFKLALAFSYLRPPLACFLTVILNLHDYLLLKSHRCNSHWGEGLMLSLLKIDVVIFSLIPLFETGIYNKVSLCFILPWEVPGA